MIALVFTFGGVGPDDVRAGYLVLLVTAIALGSIGLFVSALVRRTQAATVINLVAVIALTAGTAFIFIFWIAMTGNSGVLPDQPRRATRARSSRSTRRPPEALMWFNPFVAQVDVDLRHGDRASAASARSSRASRTRAGGVRQRRRRQLRRPARTRYWPRSLAAMLVASLVLIVLSVQLVSPTRRWRLRLPRRRAAGPAEERRVMPRLS